MDIIVVDNKEEGTLKAYNLLKNAVDDKTLLLLSGGTSPDSLYKLIAEKKHIKPAVAALVDERFGETNHAHSNERMVDTSGLSDYFSEKNIAQYNILEGKSFEETVADYDHIIRFLFQHHDKKVAIMGIGSDGHTAGIQPHFHFEEEKYVVGYESTLEYPLRITLTFEALKSVDMFIVLAFGESKKDMVKRLAHETDKNQFPAAFYKELSQKVYLITDVSL